MDERTVITDESQESSRPGLEVAGSHKSAASSEKSDSEPSESGRSVSPPLAVSPRNKRKRDDVDDSGTSKPAEAAAEETSPEKEDAFDPYDGAGSVSS